MLLRRALRPRTLTPLRRRVFLHSSSAPLDRSTAAATPAPPSSLLVASCAPYKKRTHTCGSLCAGDVGTKVVLTGWILPERKMKTINKSFYHLKDSYGTTQLLVDHIHGDAFSKLSQIPVESTVLIEGTVALRPIEARKPGSTGEIDLIVENVTLLNPAGEHMPFYPSNPHNLPNDEIRARYRYLDLRRTALSENIKKRSKVAHIVRSLLHDQDFIEVETPTLLRSSPEGAREFLVPARSSAVTDGGLPIPVFYALSQSPQQPKQMLICSGGIDKYFQIAKCFRDEDGRKDRQPEFTQVDLEMAFVSWGEQGGVADSSAADSHRWRIGGHEVRDVAEGIVRAIWKDVQGIELPEKFRVMTYHEAMTRFGSDKPDTRFGMEIINLSDVLSSSTASIDQKLDLASSDLIMECIVVRKSGAESGFSKGSLDLIAQKDTLNQHIEHFTLTETTRETWLLESKAAAAVTNAAASQSHDALPPPAAALSKPDQTAINKALKLRIGDQVWLSYRPREPTGGSTALGRTRLQIFERAQSRGDFIVTQEPHFLWITEFPLFTRDDADKEHLALGRWSSSHHPFTAPMWEDVDALYRGGAAKVRGQHYDLVLNGVEIGGGSVRVHDASMQDHIFSNILKLNESEKSPFDQLLHALRCGAPPHGGIALGFDRIMAILCDTQSIRDVIAFPKTATGTDLLFKSPAPVSDSTLAEYKIAPRTQT